MRLFIFIISIFSFTAGFTQNNYQNDDYAEARKLIADIDTIVTPYGLQESMYADIGGVKQWINVRGKDKRKPILLFVHGGPGSPLNPVSWIYQKPLEEYFIVVNYDQRGTGKTFVANDTLNLKNSMSIDHFVNDIIDITKFICQRYKKQKVVLVGHSWGTIIGMKAALKKPELFYAYVGMGQVINAIVNEKIIYEYGLTKAKEDHNEEALEELKSIYPYPGDNISREKVIIARKWTQYYGGLSAYRKNSDYYFNAASLSPNYSLREVTAIDAGTYFTLGKVLKELSKVDLSNIKKFPIPVIMFCGKHDYTTPTLPTIEWMKNVKAPFKKTIWFEHSAHLIPVEEPGKMFLSFLNTVAPFCK